MSEFSLSITILKDAKEISMDYKSLPLKDRYLFDLLTNDTYLEQCDLSTSTMWVKFGTKSIEYSVESKGHSLVSEEKNILFEEFLKSIPVGRRVYHKESFDEFIDRGGIEIYMPLLPPE
ncbi:MAG: hypothetical protein SCK57_10455 [Bacillota bacterium]|nr:hypothetical protein [Bacillota bacterium]MDW7678070.1 hypothetical protein [Bacillota bacterium]